MQLHQCRVSIIKYVPDVVKDESVNVGLMFHCWNEKFLMCKFSSPKINKIKSLDPTADLDFIQSMIDDLEIQYNIMNRTLDKLIDNSEYANPNFLQKMSKTHSNNLRFSEPKALIAANIESEIDRAFEQYVGVEEKHVKKQPIEARNMKSVLKKEFANRKLLNTVVKKDVTVKGKFDDDIKFDFGYLNGKTNYIQNLSFDTSSINHVDHAKLWYTNFQQVKSKENAGIIVVYCPPVTREDSNFFNSAYKYLKEGADKLIDYTHEGQLAHLIQQVSETAHN